MRRILLYLLILFSAPCCAATYKLVTDASELKVGDKVIIASTNTGDWVMTSDPTKTKSSLNATSGFFSDNKGLLFNPLDNVLELTLEGSSSGWYLKSSSDSYLASPKTNKDKKALLLSAKNNKNNSTKVIITISDDHAIIEFADNNCIIYFAVSAKTFKSQTVSVSSDGYVKIYKKVDDQPSVVGSSEYCSNKKAIEEWMNKQMDITLYRSFVADGGYYTLCLPFDVKQDQLKTVFGESTEAFSFANASTVNGEYNVYLSAETGILTAGTPYIIKPSKDVTNPVFNDVTVIDSIGKPVTSNQVTFKGLLDPSNMTMDKSQRFLGGSKGLTLLYPNAKAAIYPTRAYFEFPSASNAKIGFSDETPNGLDQVSAPSCTAKSYFTIDGRMLENKPTHDGIYIMDGHKVILHKR